MEQQPIPTFAKLAADPEIAALLDFTPVTRKVNRPDGWTPDLQRELIARIAATGTLQQAVWQMGKHATGAEGLYKKADAVEFRAAWDAALALGRRRNGLDSVAPFAGEVPGITRRPPRGQHRDVDGLARDINGRVREPGQRLNERGEWEDEASLNRRGAEAKESIAMKLLNCRRLYLQEIADCPGKRAAFEILTEYPVDWDKARQLEPQDDEPWKRPNMREAEWIVTAESGWLAGECGYGEDKKAAAQEEINRPHRRGQGADRLARHRARRAGPRKRRLPALDQRRVITGRREMKCYPDGPPPAARTFSLNSKEFYDAVCRPGARPWIANGALARDARLPDRQVLIERSDGTTRWAKAGDVVRGGG